MNIYFCFSFLNYINYIVEDILSYLGFAMSLNKLQMNILVPVNLIIPLIVLGIVLCKKNKTVLAYAMMQVYSVFKILILFGSSLNQSFYSNNRIFSF